MDQALFDEHLSRAISSPSSYERFECAWKAFNVLFDADATSEDDKEGKLFRDAARRIEPDAAAIFNHISLHSLVSIEPIFEEKRWRRAGVKDTRRHREVRDRLKQVGTRPATGEDLRALVDLLNVIRCNLVHGLKTPDRPRDQEVLDASAPILLTVVQAAHAYQVKRGRDSA